MTTKRTARVWLGIGAAAERHLLTAPNLARLLQERVLLKGVKQRVKALAREMRKENGLDEACRMIDQVSAAAHSRPAVPQQA